MVDAILSLASTLSSSCIAPAVNIFLYMESREGAAKFMQDIKEEYEIFRHVAVPNYDHRFEDDSIFYQFVTSKRMALRRANAIVLSGERPQSPAAIRQCQRKKTSSQRKQRSCDERPQRVLEKHNLQGRSFSSESQGESLSNDSNSRCSGFQKSDRKPLMSARSVERVLLSRRWSCCITDHIIGHFD